MAWVRGFVPAQVLQISLCIGRFAKRRDRAKDPAKAQRDILKDAIISMPAAQFWDHTDPLLGAR